MWAGFWAPRRRDDRNGPSRCEPSTCPRAVAPPRARSAAQPSCSDSSASGAVISETSVAVVPWAWWKATASAIASGGVGDAVAAATVHVQVDVAGQQPCAREIGDGRIDRGHVPSDLRDAPVGHLHPGVGKHTLGRDHATAAEQLRRGRDGVAR